MKFIISSLRLVVLWKYSSFYRPVWFNLCILLRYHNLLYQILPYFRIRIKKRRYEHNCHKGSSKTKGPMKISRCTLCSKALLMICSHTREWPMCRLSTEYYLPFWVEYASSEFNVSQVRVPARCAVHVQLVWCGAPCPFVRGLEVPVDGCLV